jgi:hypothetical protein
MEPKIPALMELSLAEYVPIPATSSQQPKGLLFRGAWHELRTLVVMVLSFSGTIAHLVQLDDVGVSGSSRELIASSVKAKDEAIGNLALLCGLSAFRSVRRWHRHCDELAQWAIR